MSDEVSLVEIDDVLAAQVRGSMATSCRFAPGFPRDDDLRALEARERGALAFLIVARGEIVGTCGTHGPVVDDSVELGWGIVEGARGRGIGTAAVHALVDAVRARAPSVHIVARTEWDEAATGLRPASAASERILTGLGFVGDSAPSAAGVRSWRDAQTPSS